MSKPVILFIELKIAAKNKYICDITEKLFQNNITVDIFTDSKNAAQLDNLLWTWKQESFIPHVLAGENTPVNGHVLISNSPENLAATEALILHDPLPAELLKNYKLIIDFAEIYHAEKKQASRQRYKEMRESGNFTIHFTQLGALLSKKSIDLSSIF